MLLLTLRAGSTRRMVNFFVLENDDVDIMLRLRAGGRLPIPLRILGIDFQRPIPPGGMGANCPIPRVGCGWPPNEEHSSSVTCIIVWAAWVGSGHHQEEKKMNNWWNSMTIDHAAEGVKIYEQVFPQWEVLLVVGCCYFLQESAPLLWPKITVLFPREVPAETIMQNCSSSK